FPRAGGAADGGAAGAEHTAAAAEDGRLYGGAAEDVAAGAEHTAAAAEDGRLYGWGWGRYGNLGLGTALTGSCPSRSPPLRCASGCEGVGVGRYGNHWWGTGWLARKLPEQVTAIESERIAQVACGWRHTIAVNGEGRLLTFGWSKYGQLGHGDFQDHLTPSPVPAMQDKRIVQVSGGWRHSVALDADGVVYAWGWNRFGQVGVGNSEDQCSPQRIESISERVVAVACGWRHTVVLSEGGNVFSWGRAHQWAAGPRGYHRQVGLLLCVQDSQPMQCGEMLEISVPWRCRSCPSQARNLPKRVEAISADVTGVAHISGPGGKKDVAAAAHAEVPDAAATWVSPAERYAVVPGEKVSHGDCSLRSLMVTAHSVSHGDCSLRSLMVTAHSGLSWSLMVSAHSGLSWSLIVSAHSGLLWSLMVTAHSGLSWSLMVSAHSGLSWSLMVSAHSGLSWSLMVSAHSGLLWSLMVSALSGLSWSLMVTAHSGLSWSLMAGEDDASVPDADAKRLKS
ncbi:unnamed protein product, partial [Closterium sp. NIES-65]